MGKILFRLESPNENSEIILSRMYRRVREVRRFKEISLDTHGEKWAKFYAALKNLEIVFLTQLWRQSSIPLSIFQTVM